MDLLNQRHGCNAPKPIPTKPQTIAAFKGSSSSGTARTAAINGAKVTILPVLKAPKRSIAQHRSMLQ